MDNIFRPLSGQGVEAQEKYYCSFGSEDFLDEDNLPRTNDANSENIVAKITCTKKPKHFNDKVKYNRYYIKMSPNLELYNPVQLHTQESRNKTQLKHINKTCKSSWLFKEVDKSVFDKYLLFLKTKNMHTFKDIERQLK